MKTLCFYISDYGYGHASRAIALIREIVDTCQDVRVIARTSGPVEFTRRSLIHPRVSVIDCRNDAGVTLKDGSLVVDRERTRESFLNWMQSWDDYISRECAFCRDHRVDLVLSDIAPQPFCVADILGIPSMAVSNFSWDTIFGHLFPDCSEVGILRDAYRQASHACILPFEIGMDGFPGRERVGLISRKISVPGPEMRKRCGVPGEDFLVYVGRGPGLPGSGSHLPLNCTGTGTSALSGAGTTSIGRHIRFLVPSAVSLPGALAIPAAETESQNWIGMCDCVITKCGYSTVSEAVRAEIPLFVWKREGFIEDEEIAGKIEELGIGRSLDATESAIESCLRDGPSLEKYKERFDTIDRQFKENGAPAIIGAVQRLLG